LTKVKSVSGLDWRPEEEEVARCGGAFDTGLRTLSCGRSKPQSRLLTSAGKHWHMIPVIVPASTRRMKE